MSGLQRASILIKQMRPGPHVYMRDRLIMKTGHACIVMDPSCNWYQHTIHIAMVPAHCAAKYAVRDMPNCSASLCHEMWQTGHHPDYGLAGRMGCSSGSVSSASGTSYHRIYFSLSPYLPCPGYVTHPKPSPPPLTTMSSKFSVSLFFFGFTL